ncbi:hypothetical protein HII28_17900 [Planctomonas sp. JC2975]|uniref:hypothetical protein n=1 Tax=Planctomonas sp. JC2975 TaxID=2729626 RepID=UPI001476266E|nr:hypothetical protein [Planctomonas sp. JC2975]NNC13742.1 hypothetical protein [Planctomonas sp. JC2975]
MILRLWRTRIVLARESEYQRFANERSLPMFRSQSGFLGLYFSGSGEERVVVTVWTSGSAAEALEVSPTYLSTVAAIQEQGFLRPPQSVEVLEIQGTTFPT